MSNPYLALANAVEGSPEHLQAVADIRAIEAAEAKAQENVIKGDGRSGHAYASHTIVPPDAVPGREMNNPGPMSVGVSSPDMREGIVKIGDMETSTEVAEAMRRSMTAAEWTSLTGLPYVSLTQVQHVYPDEKAKAAAKLEPVKQELQEVNELEQMLKENEDQHRQDTDNELQSYEPSLLEKVLDQHYGPDMTANLQRAVVESGEIDGENLTKLGVTDEMAQEAVAHYTEVAEKMLEPVGSCTAYLSNFLTEGEALKARAAIVGRDMSEVQRLGMIARDRAAAMDLKQITEFLTTDERMKLRVRQQGSLIMVDLPHVGATSWANAVVNGLISFRG